MKKKQTNKEKLPKVSKPRHFGVIRTSLSEKSSIQSFSDSSLSLLKKISFNYNTKNYADFSKYEPIEVVQFILVQALNQWRRSKTGVGRPGLSLIPLVARMRFPAIVPTDLEPGTSHR